MQMLFPPREKQSFRNNNFKRVLNAFVLKEKKKKVVKHPTLLLGKLGENKR